ncbi:hypothetical protein WM33_00785 [Burkholderia multivorans]|nr:hypothetical protein WM33_00785 [Burkholderia multivorans]KVZ78671.1 hypothetical protein WL23_17790 [Burkholderia multivorans]
MNLAARFCPYRKENTDSFNSLRNSRHYLHDRPRAHTARENDNGRPRRPSSAANASPRGYRPPPGSAMSISTGS